jgi:nucleoside-diphosphate-sugar epimerase
VNGKNTILITGATGYIGSNLTRHLLSAGYDVHILVRPTSDIGRNLGFDNRIKVHSYSGETEELINIMQNARPHAVFHLAAMFVSEHKTGDIVPLVQSNILLGTQLLEAAGRSGVRYFINTGTHWQNYSGYDYNPVNLYAATKQAFEAVARFYTQTFEMRMLTVKLIDTYGPFDPRPKVMSLFKRIAKSGETLDMSPGEQQLGLVYIDDVVKGFMLAMDYVEKMSLHDQRTCFLVPKEIHTLKDVAQIFQQVSGHALNINWGKRPYRQREIMKVSTSEINILEGHTTTNLKDGIRYMLEKEGWY